jgi:hypothetical protein
MKRLLPDLCDLAEQVGMVHLVVACPVCGQAFVPAGWATPSDLFQRDLVAVLGCCPDAVLRTQAAVLAGYCPEPSSLEEWWISASARASAFMEAERWKVLNADWTPRYPNEPLFIEDEASKWKAPKWKGGIVS